MSRDAAAVAPLLKFSPLPRRAVQAVAILVYLFLYLPMLVLILYSFSESKILTFPITGFTLKWYGELAGDNELLTSILNSLIVAAGVVPASLLLGGAAALVIDRFSFPARGLF